MSAALENPDVLSLAAGFTDTASLPVAMVTGAVDELRTRGAPPEHLQYGSTQGRPQLRAWLSARVAAQDGLASSEVPAAGTIIGTGSQQLLYLAIQVLCDPGDIVLVEQPSYFVLLDMLAGLGVRAVSLPADETGALDCAALGAQLARLKRSGEAARIKAVYVMGYFGNPSGLSRSAAEMNALAEALRSSGLTVPVIEDAAYRELWFHEPCAARSVLALESWRDWPRMYVGTLTKPFATGMKIGFGHVTDAAWLERIIWLKGHHDFGSPNFNQALLETVLARGGLDAHLRKLRPAYAAKMEALHHALTSAGLRELGWHWQKPRGGLYLWLRGPDGCDTAVGSAFWRACLEEGVLYVPGGLCFGDRDEQRFVRLSFGVLAPAALEVAAARFVRAAGRLAEAAPARN